MIIFPSLKPSSIFKKRQINPAIFVGGLFQIYGGTETNGIFGLNSSGNIDTNFSIGTGFNGGSAVTSDIQPDDKIIIGGSFTSYNGVGKSRIIRLNSDGTIDTTFNAGFNNAVLTVAVQSDGKILCGGFFAAYTYGSIVYRTRIIRLNSNGSVDTSFNIGTGFNNQVYKIIALPDGNIIVGGIFTNYNGTNVGSTVVLNSDGTLNTSFFIGAGFNNIIYDIGIQSDGKIIYGGAFTTYNGTVVNRIVRLNSDKTIDTSFNTGTGFNNIVYAIKIQSDGKIIYGGAFTTYNGATVNRIARSNSDGTRDTNFNTGTGFNNTISTIGIQSNDKLVIGGSFTTYNGIIKSRIIMLNSDGTIDANSGIQVGSSELSVDSIKIKSDDKIIAIGAFIFFNGKFSNYIAKLNFDGNVEENNFNTGTSFNGETTVILSYAKNKIIVGGNFTNYNGVVRNRIIKLNSDGTVDTSFNTSFNNIVYTIAVQSDGKIIIGGAFTGYNRIARLNSNGSIDTSFNIGTGFNGIVYTIKIQSDGKIIVGGGFTAYNGTSVNRVVRLNSNGTIDTTFNIGTGFNNVISSSAIQSDEKIILGGIFTTYNGSTISRIVRLNSDGTVDTNFNIGIGFNGKVNTILIQADEKIVCGGEFTSYNNNSRNRMIRLNSDGTVDTSFNIGSGFNNTVNIATIQSDNKILVGGLFTRYITRLNSDGSIDTSFNKGSASTINAISII